MFGYMRVGEYHMCSDTCESGNSVCHMYQDTFEGWHCHLCSDTSEGGNCVIYMLIHASMYVSTMFEYETRKGTVSTVFGYRLLVGMAAHVFGFETRTGTVPSMSESTRE